LIFAFPLAPWRLGVLAFTIPRQLAGDRGDDPKGVAVGRLPFFSFYLSGQKKLGTSLAGDIAPALLPPAPLSYNDHHRHFVTLTPSAHATGLSMLSGMAN
jgi:hypothetical protein